MRTTNSFSILLAALFLSPAVTAESSPEATPWLEKLLAIYERGPFEVDFEGTLDMSSLGQPMKGALKGHVLQGDRLHSVNRIELSLEGGPTGTMNMNITTVSDGTTIWSELDNPGLGKQVTKITMEDVEKLGQSAGGFAMSPKNLDPVAQLEALTQVMDFELVEAADDEVTLRGRLNDEGKASFGLAAMPGLESFLIVLDQETGFPTSVRAEGSSPVFSMTFSNLELIDAESLEDGTFSYTPPEGVPVMDLGALAGQAVSQ